MNDVESAVESFKSGLSCTQAIMTVYGVRYGLERATAMKVAAGFGGGMGRLGEVCGAVTGAIMVIGLKYGATTVDDAQAKERTHALVREFAAKFTARHHCLRCRELLGCDIRTVEGMQLAKDKGLFVTLCPKLVEDSALILEELLGPPPGGAAVRPAASPPPVAMGTTPMIDKSAKFTYSAGYATSCTNRSGRVDLSCVQSRHRPPGAVWIAARIRGFCGNTGTS